MHAETDENTMITSNDDAHAIASQPVSQEVCEGEMATFYVSATGENFTPPL